MGPQKGTPAFWGEEEPRAIRGLPLAANPDLAQRATTKAEGLLPSFRSGDNPPVMLTHDSPPYTGGPSIRKEDLIMAEVMKLKVETGAVTVEVEDERGKVIGSFDFNPADSNILKRYGAVVDFFNTQIAQRENATDEEKLDALNALAADIEGQFDFLLGYKVSDGLFGACGPLTVTKNGDFYFEQVLEKIGGLVEQVTQKRLDKKLAKINKAVAAAPKSK